MPYFKKHVLLRIWLILLFFVAGLALVIVGWRMTGQLAGLILMLVGLALLLAALLVYNKPYESTKTKRAIRK